MRDLFSFTEWTTFEDFFRLSTSLSKDPFFEVTCPFCFSFLVGSEICVSLFGFKLVFKDLAAAFCDTISLESSSAASFRLFCLRLKPSNFPRLGCLAFESSTIPKSILCLADPRAAILENIIIYLLIVPCRLRFETISWPVCF